MSLWSRNGDVRPGRSTTSRDRRRSASLVPIIEGLESRWTPAITWNTAVAPTGGDWDVASNWNDNGQIPGPNDIVDIDLTGAGVVTHSMSNSNSVLGLNTNINTTLELTAGSIAVGVGPSTLDGPTSIVSGSTMSLANGASLALSTGVSLNVGGTLNLGSGDTITLDQVYNGPSQINVGGSAVGNTGVINSAHDSFLNSGGNASTQINVGAGGELKAAGDSFALTALNFAVGSVVAAGDLSGNTFALPVSIPAASVPMLSGGSNDNVSFQDIDILPGTLAGGTTLNLNAIGTGAGASALLRYVLPANSTFVVSAGATLNVAANVSLALSTGVSLNVGGTLNLGSGDTITLDQVYNGPSQINVGGSAVGNTGVINSAHDSFLNSGGNASTQINVGAGGELKAAGDSFALTALNFAVGSVVAAGDLSGNTFALPVSIPAASVPMLSGGSNDNVSFQDIDILPGTLAGGTTLNLNAIGTGAGASALLRYVLPANSTFVVSAGATLNVAANVSLALSTGVSLNVGGTLNLGSGDTITLDQVYNGPSQINVGGSAVGNTGVINSAHDSFLNSGGNASTQINVGAGGLLSATADQFSLSSLTVNSGGTLDLTTSQLANQLALNAGGTYSISGNDFSNIGANGVVASGDANATIPLIGNYWGTTDPTSISAKILDHADDSTRPSINYVPFLSATSGTLAASKTVSYTVASQPITLTATVSTTAGVKINEGTETFTIYNGAQVVGSPTTPVNVSNGAASATYTLPAGTAPGKYTIQASYSGYISSDPNAVNYSPATDTSQLLTVNPASTTTTVMIGGNSVVYNANASQAPTLTATIISSAGTVNEGTVTFTVMAGSTEIGQPLTSAVSGGTASASFTVPAGTFAGSYTIQAAYTDPANLVGSTGTNALVVGRASTTVAVNAASTPYSPNGGSQVYLSAQLSSPTGTIGEGAVTFTVVDGTGATVGTAASGSVTSDFAYTYYLLPANLPAGTYTVQARFTGSTDYAPSAVATGPLVVSSVTTTGAADPASATFSTAAQNLALGASVSSTMGSVSVGTVTFTILTGTTLVVSSMPIAVSAGRAGAVVSLPAGLGAGSYSIQVVYSGSGSLLGFTDMSGKLTVGQAGSSVLTDQVAAVNVSTVGQTIALGATVTSTGNTIASAPNSVTFQLYSGSTPEGNALTVNVVSGRATGNYTLPAGLVAGSYTVSTTFAGTANFIGSSDMSRTLVITKAASSVLTDSVAAINPSTSNQTIALGATVTSTLGTVNAPGSVMFQLYNGSTPVGNPLTADVLNGRATGNYTVPGGLPVGTYTITTTFAGTSTLLGSTDSSRVLVVVKATSAVVTDPVTAVYFTAATQSIALGATVTSSLGTVSAPGSVMFQVLNGSTPVAAAMTADLVNGRATTTYTLPAGLAAGSYTISTTFAGTVNTSGSSDASRNLVVNKAVSLVSTNPVSILYNGVTGQSVTFGASISGPGGVVNAPGSVMFQVYNGATTVGSAMPVGVINGLATVTYTLPAGLAAGSYTISTAFAGTANLSAYTDKSASLVLKVVKAATTANLTTSTTSTSLNQPVTLSATIASVGSGAGVPTGTVTFLDGATSLGTITLGATGQASLVVPKLALGTHPITVTYSGDGFDSPSITSAASVYVGDLPKDDYDGDGKADIAIFGKDPVSGLYRFEILTSSTGFNPAKAIIFNNNGYGYGNSTSIPVPGDYFGDGRDAYALWTPNASGGMTFSAVSSVTFKSVSINFGSTSDIPIVADLDGDGKADFGVYGYQSGLNYRFDFLLSSYNFVNTAQLIFNNNGYGYGGATSIPVVADFDGSGKAGFGLFTPASSGGLQANSVTGSSYTASTFSYVSSSTSFSRTIGTQYDIPGAVDLDGDGKADLVLFGPDPAKSGHYRYLALTSSSNFSTATPVLFDNNGYGYGNSSSVPTVDDYEGTGKADFSVFTPDFSGGMEIVYQTSQTGNGVLIDFASSTDIDLSTPLYLRARKVRGQ